MLDRIRGIIAGWKLRITVVVAILSAIIMWSEGTIGGVECLAAILGSLQLLFAKEGLQRGLKALTMFLQSLDKKLPPVPPIAKLLFVGIILLGAAGCGYHIVKYDPQELASITSDMEQTFIIFDERVVPKSDDKDEVAAIETLARRQRQNYAKIRELTRTE